MPIIIPETLPAKSILERENVFVMGRKRARSQDIRSLKLAILNLMPTKKATETQLLRLMANTVLQVDVTLLHTRTYQSKNTPAEHLVAHYQTIEKVKEKKFDGLIITGAPVEHLNFHQVAYWEELQTIMDWSEEYVYSTLHICWAAQAGLYHRYGIPKFPLSEKLFGVFSHRVLDKNEKLLRGFDDTFYAPHSRHTEIRQEDIENVSELDLLSRSEKAGVYIAASKNRRQFYITGHSEYGAQTLKKEYERDLSKGLSIDPPENYFPEDNLTCSPLVRWRGHAHLMFSNWLNYYVYQRTPYDINHIQKM